MMHALPAGLRLAVACLPLTMAVPLSAQDGGKPRARTHLVVGELVRLDLPHRTMVVKVTTEGTTHEIDVTTDDETRISSRGRLLQLAEMRPGERVLVSCTDEGTRHRAQRVKAGGSPPSPPVPSASPLPATVN